jgi:hypothetical protein
MSVTLSETKLTPAVLAELDLIPIDRLQTLYGPGQTVTEYQPTRGYWQPGDGRPFVAFEDDPAAAQAAGRCAASRSRFAAITGGRAIHPTRCGWCDYRLEDLLCGLDHAAFHARHISAEYQWWPAKDGSYARPTNRAGTYENPRWAAWYAQDRALRERAIDHAAAREEVVDFAPPELADALDRLERGE